MCLQTISGLEKTVSNFSLKAMDSATMMVPNNYNTATIYFNRLWILLRLEFHFEMYGFISQTELEETYGAYN